MKKALITLTALAVATPAAAQWLPTTFLDRADCNRELNRLRKANPEIDAFFVCRFDPSIGRWLIYQGTR